MRVLAAAGATGGHIFPAISFLDILKERYNAETLLILPEKSIIKDKEGFAYNAVYVPVYPVQLRLDRKNIFAIAKFFHGSLKSLFILLKFRPEIVVGFGSLACVPVVIFAWFFRIAVIIHEQNVIPGEANRFLSWFADKVAVSFAETKDYFSGIKQKIVLTGNPLRKEMIRIERSDALDFFGLSEDKFTILAMGGSAGAHKLNLEFLKALSALRQKDKLQVIHLSGNSDYDFLKDSYRKLGINYKLYSFLDNMQYAYSASDVVLSRAGAGTISEIIYFGLPAILLPYPYAYKHQLNNARVLEKINSAVIIEDQDLDAYKLGETIGDFINNPDKARMMRLAYAGILTSNAAGLLADEAAALLK